MEVLYHDTNKLIHEIQSGLCRLESASGDVVDLLENEIQAHIDKIYSNCDRLDILVNKEPPSRRSNAKLRVDQLKYDCKHLQSSLRTLQNRRYQAAKAESEREALLSTRFSTNDGETTIMMDAELQHHQRLSGAHRGMDEMLLTGSSVISNLREQRITLKGAHKKILDVANTLGLSNTVLRLIEKRTYQDKFIMFTGMVLTCVVMFLVWRYFT